MDSGGCHGFMGGAVCRGHMGVNMLLVGGVAFDASAAPPEPIGSVYLTHGHWDHFSRAGVLAERGARVYAPRLCRVFVEEPRVYWMATLCFHGPVEEAYVTRYFTGGGVEVSGVVDPGPLPGGLGEALAAPGHTPGSMVYLVDAPGGRVLAAGDTVYGWSYLESSPFLYHVDTVAWIETLEKLAGLEVDGLVPGHGEPVEGGREARRLLEANRGKVLEMLRLVEEQLPGPGEEPVYADEVAARVAEATGYASSRRVYSILCPTVRALLKGLAAMGRAEASIVRGVPAWRRRRGGPQAAIRQGGR